MVRYLHDAVIGAIEKDFVGSQSDTVLLSYVVGSNGCGAKGVITSSTRLRIWVSWD
jgi:hypothetical protein